MGAQRIRHGYAKHGKDRNGTYNTWRAMKQRCLDSNYVVYHYYGGRGIMVCQQWIDSFLNFLADMGERPVGKTLDRINNEGNYTPANCRWSTRHEQQANRRKYGTVSCIKRKTLQPLQLLAA